MDKNYWLRKLTSRKLWVSIAGFITALLVGFGVDTTTVERVTAIIMAGALAISYIVGEGFIDVEREKHVATLDVLADDLNYPPLPADAGDKKEE